MTQAHDPKFPQTAGGSLYPTNYVVGVIDDLQEAQQAEQAFKQAGYDAQKIRLMEGHEATEKVQELEEGKNWFQHFLSSFQNSTDETGSDVYQLAAQQGKQILHVRADSQADVDKISALMMRYHAHAVKFFGSWSVSDIPPQSLPKQ